MRAGSEVVRDERNNPVREQTAAGRLGAGPGMRRGAARRRAATCACSSSSPARSLNEQGPAGLAEG